MQTKYPGLFAVIALIAAIGKDFAVQNETALQKLESTIGLVPQVLGALPLFAGLGAEISALKSGPNAAEDTVALLEVLVTDFAFSSEKAKEVIAVAFPYAEKLAVLVADTPSLVAAIKA